MDERVATAAMTSLSRPGVTVKTVSRDDLRRAIESMKRPAVAVADPTLEAVLSGTTVAVDPTPRQLDEAATGITMSSCYIEANGSIVLEDLSRGCGLVSLYVDHHVAVLRARDGVRNLAAAVDRLSATVRDRRRSAIIASGPSATADMGELVYGAHGPEHVHVLLLEEERANG